MEKERRARGRERSGDKQTGQKEKRRVGRERERDVEKEIMERKKENEKEIMRTETQTGKKTYRTCQQPIGIKTIAKYHKNTHLVIQPRTISALLQ